MRYLLAIIFRMMPRGRFASSTAEDRERVLQDAVPKSTRKVTSTWVSALTAYAEEKNKQIDFKTIKPEDLASLLEGFFVDARRKNGEPYKRNSLKSAAASINRHLLSVQPEVNLFQHHAFKKSHQILDGVLKERKRQGEEAAVQHKEAVSPGDLEKLRLYFDDVDTTDDPCKLSMYVWYLVTTHFCLRGGEIQSKLSKSDLVFSSPDGKERITLATDFMSKNHSGGLKGTSFSTIGCIEDDAQIATIKTYLERLNPNCDRLFQRANLRKTGMSSTSSSSSVWYMNMPLSHNLLSVMMRKLSAAADLSQTYTNHCLRATSICLMKRAGLEDRKIMAVSGHKNVQSLEAYDRPTLADGSAAAAAIDCKPGEVASSSEKENVPAVDACSAISSVSGTAACSTSPPPVSPGASGICVYGSSNVTITLPPFYPPARPSPARNPRLPLKLKKKSTVRLPSKPY